MNVFGKLYKELKKKYGRPEGQWGLWRKRPKTESEREEVAMGAVLTQRTNWNNVEMAINNLKRAKMNSLKSIYRLGSKSLENLIKPSGFYKAKARCLFNLARFVVENYGSLESAKEAELEELREKLLKLKGIGLETADSILLYSLDKPIFVIDEYTKRLVRERNLASKTDYQFLQRLFEENLERDYLLYQDFHALIVIRGKTRSKNF